MARRWRYTAEQAIARTGQRILFGFEVEGRENVPLEGACILAANHKSYLDPPAVGCCLEREIRYFAKKELFDIPVISTIIRDCGAFPVNRGSFDKTTFRNSIKLLRAGQALLLFPEGTRIRRKEFGKPKEGVSMLALQANVPVIPVWVGHTWEPRRGLFRRIPIRVRFGNALNFTALSPDQDRRERYREVAEAIMSAIAQLERTENPT